MYGLSIWKLRLEVLLFLILFSIGLAAKININRDILIAYWGDGDIYN